MVDGIASIMVLDFDDLNGLRFDSDNLYNNCLVTAILRSGDFVEISAPESAKYSSTLQSGIYTHTLETFIGELSHEWAAMLHLSTKRRYIVFFRAKSGRYFCFGYEAGASSSYTNQTTDGTGSLVTFLASSIYPLFEVTEIAFTDEDTYNVEFIPDFDSGAYCELE